MTLSMAIDVSNTLDSRRRSGVQRFTVGLIRQLVSHPGVDLTLLDGRSGRLRPLSERSQTALVSHFAHQTNSVGGRLLRRVRREQLSRLPVARPWIVPPRNEGDAKPTTPSWLIDIDAAWHAPMDRAVLLPSLRANPGVRSAALVHDLLPIIHPEWFPSASVERFGAWLEAHRDNGSVWLANSHTTASGLRNWLGDRSKPVAVIHPGVETHAHCGHPDGTILMVGTVEPRKGHELLIDALDLMARLGPRPVIDVVGSAGWASPQLKARLDSHPAVRWHQSLDDHQLEKLWAKASLLLQPSRDEGFGLPVAEALARGIPVFASSIEVMRESSQGCAELIDLNPSDWAHAIGRFGSDRRWAAELQRRARNFAPPGWGYSTQTLVDYLTFSL